MKNPNQSVEAKHRRVFIFSVMIISFMMLSCWAGADDPNEGSSPPTADITNGLVMNGTATITRYNLITCTNTGTAVLTVNSDNTFVLVLNNPSVDGNCVPDGDRVNDRLYGTVDVKASQLYITACYTDRQPVGDTGGWINGLDAGGEAICYSVKPNGARGPADYHMVFDVFK